jgi:hypothetical protein
MIGATHEQPTTAALAEKETELQAAHAREQTVAKEAREAELATKDTELQALRLRVATHEQATTAALAEKEKELQAAHPWSKQTMKLQTVAKDVQEVELATKETELIALGRKQIASLTKRCHAMKRIIDRY